MRSPQFFPVIARAAAIAVLYGVAATATILLTRFDGGVAHLWVATAVLLAELIVAPRRAWAPTLAGCGMASLLATGIFGFGWAAAGPLAVINVAEAVIGALLLKRLGQTSGYLESIASVAMFSLAVGAVGPAISGFFGAAIASWSGGFDYGQSWFGWVFGHGLGTLTFTPILAMVLHGEIDRWLRAASARLKLEAIILTLVMIAVCWVVFAQDGLPLLFVPMLPLMIITFRLGRPGAAAAIVMLTVVGGILTARGFGPINLIEGSDGERSEFFQFYLAITVLIVLPIAAELKHRKLIFRQLQESEARHKLITESATDMLVTFDVGGTIVYASPSSMEIAGFAAATMIGRKGGEFVDPRDLDIVLDVQRTALAQIGATHTAVYRGPTENKGTRWFEARARGIADETGQPTGVVCAIRDISERKLIEAQLSHAASTDALTGLSNRRVFDIRLDSEIAGAALNGTSGCVAIFDLDRFKQINDRFGHPAGDQVLRAFAEVALRIMPDHALVARLGGEEFGVILPDTTTERAAELCNRLRRATAALKVDVSTMDRVSATVSAGIADFSAESTRAMVMRAADHALYTAKAAGRDRLRIAA